MSTLAPPQRATVPAAAGGPTQTSPRRRRRPPLSWLRRWPSPLLLILLWQVGSWLGFIPEQKIASPLQILATGKQLVLDGTLGSETLVSVQRVALGFAIGALVGVVLAVVAGLSRLGEDAVAPPMQMLRTLPHFGLIPLLIVWLGIGEMPKIALIALGVVFPLYLNTFAGIRSIDRKFLEAAKTLHLNRRQRLRHVVIPGAVPQALVGLRQSLGVAWLSLIVAETVSASSGLGYMINHAREFLQTDVIVVGLAVYRILGLLTDSVVRFLERRALSWSAISPAPPTPRPVRRTGSSPGSSSTTGPSGARACSAGSTSRSTRASSSPCSVAAAPGSPRCCAVWPVSTRRLPGRSPCRAGPRSPSRSHDCCPGAASRRTSPWPCSTRRRVATAGSAPARPSTRSVSGTSTTCGRSRCPVDRRSASPSRGPWSATRTCCCWTSRSAPSTR